MRSVPPSAPGSPVLSNWLTAQADDVARDVATYRRGSLEAHRAYLAGASKLVSARGECRRGQWGPFLERAGITARAAQDMMALSRAGVTAERMTEYGGVRGALEALRAAAAGAVEAVGEALDGADGEGEKSATVAGFSLPGAVPDTAGDDAPVGGAEGVSEGDTGREGVSVPPESATGVSGVSEGLPGGRRALTTREAADADRNRREARAARGLCVSCGRERAAPGKRQGERCLERDRKRTRSRLAGGRYVAALDRRLRAALDAGRGLNLSAGDVARLLGDKAKG